MHFLSHSDIYTIFASSEKCLHIMLASMGVDNACKGGGGERGRGEGGLKFHKLILPM